MTNKMRTPEEKKAIIDGFAAAGLSVQDYSKQKKISVSQFYSWQRALNPKVKSHKKKARPSDAPNGGFLYAVNLKAQNQVLKEMLADAYNEIAALKIAA